MIVVVTTMSQFVAEENRTEGSVHVVLIVTGSVASIKVPLIVRELSSVGFLGVFPGEASLILRHCSMTASRYKSSQRSPH